MAEVRTLAPTVASRRPCAFLKRVENLMLENGVHREVQSFFIESLVYNCPDGILNRASWVDTISGVLGHIWNELEGDEPSESSDRSARSEWVHVSIPSGSEVVARGWPGLYVCRLELLGVWVVKQRTAVQVIAGVVVLVFAIGIWASGDQVHVAWLRFFSVAVFVATAVLIIWERFLWRLSLPQRLRFAPRHIAGTWKGTLTSFWIDPATGKPPDKKTVYLVVRQTAYSVSMILLTDESKSVSDLAVVSGSDGTCSLDYMYLNQPESRFEHRSHIHHGSTSLNITGLPPTRLKGRYWTDRDSKGELDFVERSNHTAEDYNEATRLFGGERGAA